MIFLKYSKKRGPKKSTYTSLGQIARCMVDSTFKQLEFHQHILIVESFQLFI
jgi:hypothetical protein